MENFDIRPYRFGGIFILIILLAMVLLGLISDAYERNFQESNKSNESIVEFEQASSEEENSYDSEISEEEVVVADELEDIDETSELNKSDEPFEVIDESELE